MSKLLPTNPYRGTRDFLPADMAIRQQVFDTLTEVLARFGFGRVDGPLIEPAALYEAKSGTEIADQQLYSLTDRGGRALAIRPEMTPTVARMVAKNAADLTFPCRWFSLVNCYRYERPQRGRLREHCQLNVDIFGCDQPTAEVELFTIINELMTALGASREQYRLRVNDRQLMQAVLTDVVRIADDAMAADVCAIVDRWEKTSEDRSQAAAQAAGLTTRQWVRLRDCMAPDFEVSSLPRSVQAASPLVALADSNPGLFEVDLRIIRGFEYYTGTVFEVFDQNPDNNRSLFGGGRYADLCGLFTKKTIPGVGFGMGDVTLIDFLTSNGLLPAATPVAQVAVLTSDRAGYATAARCAAHLRAAGVRTVSPLVPQAPLRNQLRDAARQNVAVAVIVPESQANSSQGQLVVRDLLASQQQTVPTKEVVAQVRQLLS